MRWRHAQLFEGPSTWAVQHDRYRIQVVDQDGSRRAGFLMFKHLWSAAQVLWDEPSHTLLNGSTVSQPQTQK